MQVKNIIYIVVITLLLNSCGMAEEKKNEPSQRSAEKSSLLGNDNSYNNDQLTAFTQKIDSLRNILKIPAISAGIVINDRLVWAGGFGYRDTQRKQPANEKTVYHLASVTKTFISVIIGRLAGKGLLDIDDPVSNYKIDLNKSVRIRNLLSHTSEGRPGSYFNYNSWRYGLLEDIIRDVTGSGLGEVFYQEIFKPLGMEYTAPNPSDPEESSSPLFNFDNISGLMAPPYKIINGSAVLSDYPDYFGASAGLVSNVIDLAVYINALFNRKLLPEQYRAECFSPFISNSGAAMPYGLGWFVQYCGNEKIIWHYGDWRCNSSLIMMLPEMKTALILLANTDGLSAPFQGLAIPGDLTYSPFAREFLRSLLLSDNKDNTAKYSGIIKDFKGKDIISFGECLLETGKEEKARRSFQSLYKLNPLHLKKYTGKYKSGNNSIVIRKKNNGHLMALIITDKKNSGDYNIYPENDSTFYLTDFKKIKFLNYKKGKYKKLYLMKTGKNIVFKQQKPPEGSK